MADLLLGRAQKDKLLHEFPSTTPPEVSRDALKLANSPLAAASSTT